MNQTFAYGGQAKMDEGSASQDALRRDLLRLVEHSVWANLQWVEAVYSHPNPEERPREILGHLMVGERAWFERIEGAQKTFTMFPLLSNDELVQGFTANADTFRQLIASRLEDVVHFRRASGEEYHARIADIIHHLLTHGYHHRGQLAAHFARSGARPRPIELAHYLDSFCEHRRRMSAKSWPNSPTCFITSRIAAPASAAADSATCDDT
jgi:uncharacterized damage-inducible protein DinB